MTRSVTQPRSILLVDDSALVRAVVSHALKKEGVNIRSIDDPRGLVAAMANERPDLLLVDATFPGVEHDELVRLVSPHTSACPVVLFSDRSPAVIEALVRDINAVGSIPKEAAGGELWARLQRFLPEA